jgi:hypothetical protein
VECAVVCLDGTETAAPSAFEVVLKKQHYVQALAQGSVLMYWGWHWSPVYESLHLILAQLLFAYAFDMLLSWCRRDTYVLGFAPFPVIFSINLFLWFRPEWFYLQFALVSLGIAAKELIRWNKDGRRAHIFNPSSFPLAVFSLALLVTGSTDLTWGREIATTQFYPPHMYLALFLIGLPGQFFFGVTLMTDVGSPDDVCVRADLSRSDGASISFTIPIFRYPSFSECICYLPILLHRQKRI